MRMNKLLRPKLAFAGPGVLMYTYGVMPFGPVSGPVIFHPNDVQYQRQMVGASYLEWRYYLQLGYLRGPSHSLYGGSVHSHRASPPVFQSTQVIILP